MRSRPFCRTPHAGCIWSGIHGLLGRSLEGSCPINTVQIDLGCSSGTLPPPCSVLRRLHRARPMAPWWRRGAQRSRRRMRHRCSAAWPLVDDLQAPAAAAAAASTTGHTSEAAPSECAMASAAAAAAAAGGWRAARLPNAAAARCRRCWLELHHLPVHSSEGGVAVRHAGRLAGGAGAWGGGASTVVWLSGTTSWIVDLHHCAHIQA